MILNPLFTGMLAGLMTGAAVFAILVLGLNNIRSRRIKAIIQAARKYSQGDFDQPFLLETHGVYKDLALVLNDMATALKARITETEQEKTKLSAVLDHMAEGVIAVDIRKDIVVMNPSARKLMHMESTPVAGRSLLEIVRSRVIDEIMEEAIHRRSIVAREIEVFHPSYKHLKIQAVGFKKPEGVAGILVLYDISEVRKLENIRREFVANVSHELRTPLTSIKGFIETLLGGAMRDPSRCESFLQMMEEDTERLTRLISRLLELSKIESKEEVFHLEPLNLSQEAERAIGLLKVRCSEKRITITNDLSKCELPPVLADRDKLKQVFVNLLDNAIKFNKEEGKIFVRADCAEDKVTVSIEDTGVGISGKDVPRIFERFYRVDKARSQELGGTGLGLAIVKHIIEGHGGSVSCESDAGKGSRFFFTLQGFKPRPS